MTAPAGVNVVGVTARGAAERGRVRPVLTNVTFAHRTGVLAIIGSHKDGTTLLFDILDGTIAPKSGTATVLGAGPGDTRRRVVRVSLEAPLPEALRVDEVCDLAADVRGEPRRPASERLGILGIASLARRRVRSLAPEERRAISLAIALSSRADVLLLDEPLGAIDPLAPRLIVGALRSRATSACVIITTASARDATRLADELGILSAGAYAPLAPELAHMTLDGGALSSIRVVVTSESDSKGRAGASALVAALGREEAVLRVETSVYASRSGAVALAVWGADLGALAHAVTRAIAASRVDVELIEPSVLPLDAIRAAVAAHVVSPPPGSLPPGPESLPPGSILPPGSMPPASHPPGSIAPPSGGGVPS